jgi:hypothetical protein
MFQGGLKLYIPPHPPTRTWYKDSKLDVNSSLPLPATVRLMKASHYINLRRQTLLLVGPASESSTEK